MENSLIVNSEGICTAERRHSNAALFEFEKHEMKHKTRERIFMLVFNATLVWDFCEFTATNPFLSFPTFRENVSPHKNTHSVFLIVFISPTA